MFGKFLEGSWGKFVECIVSGSKDGHCFGLLQSVYQIEVLDKFHQSLETGSGSNCVDNI